MLTSRRWLSCANTANGRVELDAVSVGGISLVSLITLGDSVTMVSVSIS